jgi:hypothetical protein
VSARLLRAFRIWLAATEVEVFSKALSSLISSASFGRLGFATAGGGEGITSGERGSWEVEELRNTGCS